MGQLFFEDVDVGAKVPDLVRDVSLSQLFKYSAATWNFYLLHLEKEFAQKKGGKDVNIHAPFYGAFLASMMTAWTGDPGRLKKLGYTVKVMGFPGDTFIGRGQVTRKYREASGNLVDCEIWIDNQDGVEVATGSATVSLSSRKL